MHALLRPLATDILPDAQLDLITVNVPYRGSTPVESEEGVVLRIEEAIHDLEGIKHLHSTASPGVGSVTIEVETGYDTRLLLDDVKARVDAISTFPAETEKPIISIPQIKIPVVMVVISAGMPERGLRRLGEVVRDRITDLPGISQTQLLGVRPYEIAIEVTEETLERYGLTMSQISQAIARSSIDIPAGAIKARHGNILPGRLSGNSNSLIIRNNDLTERGSEKRFINDCGPPYNRPEHSSANRGSGLFRGRLSRYRGPYQSRWFAGHSG